MSSVSHKNYHKSMRRKCIPTFSYEAHIEKNVLSSRGFLSHVEF